MSFSCQFSLNFSHSWAHFLGSVLEARDKFEPNFCLCMFRYVSTLHFAIVCIFCAHVRSLSIKRVDLVFDLLISCPHLW